MKTSKLFILKAAFFIFSSYICIVDISAACSFSRPLRVTEVQIGNILAWATKAETNHAYFRVEKSIDGINFKEAGRVKAGAGSDGERSYQLFDAGVGESRIFYRLAIVGTGQNVEYTETVLFNRLASHNIRVLEMSSVLTDAFFTVTLESAQAGLMTYNLSNPTCVVTKTGEARIKLGRNVQNFDLRGMEKGMYALSLKMDKETEKLWIKKVDAAEAPQIMLVVKNK